MMRSIYIILVAGFLAPAAAAQEATPSTRETAPRDIAARVRPAVVLIKAMVGERVLAQGSGFVISADGKIVTNRHVIEGARSLVVQLASGETYDRVFYVSDDARRDLAILRIPATDLKPLAIGDDRQVEVGDKVYVMGNPRGLEGTFSDGIVSAKRTVEGISLVQISAPISPGSSGGPVLNAKGEVIGVATLTMTNGQNLNMAVPARYASGLLAMDEQPQPFERVADRFKPADSPESNATTAATGGSNSAYDKLEPWERSLVDQMVEITAAAKKLGLTATHKPFIDTLEEDKRTDIEYTFTANTLISVVGVCDVDCSDLDIAVFDLKGTLIAKDVSKDDRPEIKFRVPRTAKYTVRVYMAKCTDEPCGFALQSFSGERK